MMDKSTVEKFKTEPAFYICLFTESLKAEDYKASLEYARRLTELEEDNYNFRKAYMLALLLNDLNSDYNIYFDSLQQRFARCPEYISARLQHLASEKKFEEAAKYMEESAEFAETEAPEYLEAAADIYLGLRDTENFRKVQLTLRDKLHRPSAYLYMAYLELADKNFAGAMQNLLVLIRQQHRNYFFYAALYTYPIVVKLSGEGDWRKSAKKAAEVMEADALRSIYHLHLAGYARALREELGDAEKADEDRGLEDALNAFINDPDSVFDELDRLRKEEKEAGEEEKSSENPDNKKE